MQIRLTRKFCDVLNGYDLRPLSIGQVIDTNEPFAAMLLAEGWAEPLTAAPGAKGRERGSRAHGDPAREMCDV
jgi:hypothetical protein